MLRMISTLALTFSMWSFQTSPPQTSAIFFGWGWGEAVNKAQSEYPCHFSSKGPCFIC